MKVIRSRISLILLLVPLVAAAHLCFASDTAPTPEELLAHLEAAEHDIVNLHVQDFEYHVEYADSENGPWMRSSDKMTGTGWYAGLLHSKARVDVKSIMPWEQGLAPWLEVEEALGFDGQYGRVAHYSAGPVGHMRSVKRGDILPDRPVFLHERPQTYADGRAFSLQFCESAFSESISEFLRKSIGKDDGCEVRRDNRANTALICLTVGARTRIRESFWFDPQKGYSLIEEEGDVDKGGGNWRTFRHTRINELAEACPNVWYPLNAWAAIEMVKPHPWVRYVYRADKAIANDPKFDESVFTIRFPKGFRITDRANSVDFVAGGTPEEMATKIDDSISKIRGAYPLPRLDTSTSVSPLAEARSGGRLIVTLSVVVVMVCALAAFTIFFRWRRRFSAGRMLSAGLMIGVPVLAYTGVTHAQTRPTTGDVQDVETRSNCAVNVGYFVLRWFDVDSNIRDVAKELGVGEEFEKPSSLADLKRLFESKGLSVQALKSETPEGLASKLDVPGIAVIRLKRIVGGKQIAHFFVLLRLQKGYVVVDSPRPPSSVVSAEFLEHKILTYATGEFLVISKTEHAANNDAEISVLAKKVDLGEIPFNTDTIDATIQYKNVGTAPLSINEVRLSCTCAGDSTGDMLVQPGNRGTLIVHLHRNRYSAGANDAPVLLVSNDPKHKYETVRLLFRVPGIPNPSKLALVPRQVDYGRLSAEKLISQSRLITLQIPATWVRDGIISILPKSSNPHLHFRAMEGPTTNPFRDGQVQRFSLNWDGAPPTGDFEEVFSVDVRSSKAIEQLAVKVRGYVDTKVIATVGTLR